MTSHGVNYIFFFFWVESNSFSILLSSDSVLGFRILFSWEGYKKSVLWWFQWILYFGVHTNCYVFMFYFLFLWLLSNDLSRLFLLVFRVGGRHLLLSLSSWIMDCFFYELASERISWSKLFDIYFFKSKMTLANFIVYLSETGGLRWECSDFFLALISCSSLLIYSTSMVFMLIVGFLWVKHCSVVCYIFDFSILWILNLGFLEYWTSGFIIRWVNGFLPFKDSLMKLL